MAYQTIRYEIDDGMLRLTLSRPDKLNAFTREMCEELLDAFRRAGADDAVRVILVTGEGRAFCAGMDLSGAGNVFGLDETLRPTLTELRERADEAAFVNGVRDLGGRLTLAMYDCLKPIVGAVNGAAIGIGATMLLPMDFRLASESARFGFVFGRLGISLEACSSWFLPRIVGHEQALEWAYRANIFDAKEALEKRLVRSVHAPEALLAEAERLARGLVAERSAVSIALIRQMLNRNPGLEHPFEAHLIESLAMFYTSQGDGKEGVRAFLEKRAPRFTSRATEMPPFYPW